MEIIYFTINGFIGAVSGAETDHTRIDATKKILQIEEKLDEFIAKVDKLSTRISEMD